MIEFQRTDDALGIFFGGKAPGRSGVHLPKALQKRFHTVLQQLRAQLRGICLVALFLSELHMIEQRVYIKPCAAGDDGQPAACGDLFDTARRVTHKQGDGIGLIGRQKVDQMVRYALHFFLCGLGGGNCHALINLHGIRRDYLAVKVLCQLHRQSRFARRGGSDYGNDLYWLVQCITPCRIVFRFHFFSSLS